MGIEPLYRWFTQNRFASVIEPVPIHTTGGPINWSKHPFDPKTQRPFQPDNGLPVVEAPEEFRFLDGRPILSAAYALYPIESASIQALCPRDVYDATPRYEYLSADGSDGIYARLLRGECDAIFALKPSAEQAAEAEKAGVQYEFTPVGRDAFVFFTNAQNPVEGLTTDQLRGIYSGRVRTWKELGVPLDKALRAFQRNKNSGSQTTMERFMGDVPLSKATEKDVIASMGAIIGVVADYRNYPGAIGYTFRYYATEMLRAGNIKLLAVDGVAPTVENIRNGTYPFVEESYLVTRGSPTGDVARLAAFLTSPIGRKMVEDIGYVAP